METLVMREPVTTKNRPISMMLPELMRAINALAQAHVGQFSTISQLEARMIGQLGHYGELTMISLVEIVGIDKSQVSHAIKRLIAAKLVQRDALRAPLKLTAAGKSVAQKLQTGARTHSESLLKGLNRSEQELFTAGISHLTQTATRLYEHEVNFGRRKSTNSRRISRAGSASSGAVPTEVLPAQLVTLGTLLQRSSFLAFKRMTGLANTESTVLAYVWDYAPMSAKHIVQLSGRNKARIERTAALLAKVNLIHRGKTLSSHDWIYDRGATGSDIYKKISAEISRREKFLIHDFSVQELNKFRTLLQRIITNVSQMQAKLA